MSATGWLLLAVAVWLGALPVAALGDLRNHETGTLALVVTLVVFVVLVGGAMYAS